MASFHTVFTHHYLQFPVVEFPTGGVIVPQISLRRDPAALQHLLQLTTLSVQ